MGRVAGELAGRWAAEPEMPRPADVEPAAARVRLGDLDTHLHCSIVGTCLTDADLRKVLARFVDVQDATDLDLHHEAVRLAGSDAQVARALHKALDARFDAVLRRFAKARNEQDVRALWREFHQRGEVPAAYWAVLSHRHASGAVRQEVFGEVHMLSHLMGASTRADLRQRVFLQAENDQLRAQHAQLQDRYQRLVETHDRTDQEHQQTATLLRVARSEIEELRARTAVRPESPADTPSEQVALHTQRREHAEQRAARAVQEVDELKAEMDHLRLKLQQVVGELHAADAQLHRWLSEESADAAIAPAELGGRRLLYVGGRPSSANAIQEWVERNGGELRRHDGGFEDRKGQLAADIAWADRVVFPVDCIDHDSAGSIKRHCVRLGIPFTPLRTASLASFVAAASSEWIQRQPTAGSHLCLRHA